jgi:hypothetical protein
MTRSLLRRFNFALCVVIVAECIALGLVPLQVPDLAARLLRLTTFDRQPPPPARIAPNDTALPRPLTLKDSFDVPSALWDQSNISIQDSHLAIQLRLPQSDAYALWLGDAANTSQVMDFTLTTLATQVSGATDASYGIRFRQETPDSYLYVALSARGYWQVLRSIAGVRTEIVPWTYSHTIEQGIGYTNELSVTAAGPVITIHINGVQVGTVTDQAPIPGQLTLSAATTASGDVRVDFDTVRGSVGGIAFSDEFDSASATRFSTGGSFTHDGQYIMRANAGVSVWQNPLPQKRTSVTDFALRLNATLVRGNPNSVGYGIVYGDTGDFSHSILLFGGNGTVQLLQSNNGKPTQRLLEPLELSMLDTRDGATNFFEVRKVGGTLTLSVNDVIVGSIDDLPVRTGSVGMILVCGSEQAEVAYDDFVLTELVP